MVDHIGFEPICYPVCQTGGHPKQPHSPNDNYQREEIASSLPVTCMTAVIALVDNLTVLSLIRRQLASVCDGSLTRKSLRTP